MESFVNFYLENREEQLKDKWKIIDFLIEENGEISQNGHIATNSKKEINEIKSYYSISRLRKLLKKSNKCFL